VVPRVRRRRLPAALVYLRLFTDSRHFRRFGYQFRLWLSWGRLAGLIRDFET
jgi:hypothetical protein